MTRMPVFRELRRVFAGYLHEDLLDENRSPEAALRMFRADADPGEAQRFRKEVVRFLSYTARLDFDQVRDLLGELGCRWIPPSREALVALLTEATADETPPQV